MPPRRRQRNPKRRLHAGLDRARAGELAGTLRYRGSPLHKRSPGDFGLTPPSAPRPGKSLCDGAGVLDVARASGLLRDGVLQGLVSPDANEGCPKYVWAIADGCVLEARCDDANRATYHGYPLEPNDPMTEIVLARLSRR